MQHLDYSQGMVVHNCLRSQNFLLETETDDVKRISLGKMALDDIKALCRDLITLEDMENKRRHGKDPDIATLTQVRERLKNMIERYTIV